MDLIELIAQAQGGSSLKNIGGQFGLDEKQTQAALQELAPVVAAGLRRNAASPEGLLELLGALQTGGHQRYLDDGDAVQFDQVSGDGNKILAHAFGSKDVSRGVAMHAAGQTGIGGAILRQLLPIIASMVMGAITRKMGGGGARRGGGGLGDIIGDVLGGGGGARGQQRRGDGGLGDILGDILGGGSAGGTRRRAPAPRPGGGLEDILGDILGGGARRQKPQYREERPDMEYNEEALNRTRETFDDTLGRGSASGNAADDLLNSVDRRLRR